MGSAHTRGVRGMCSGSQATRAGRAFSLVWVSWVSCAGSEPCVEAALCQLPLRRAEDAAHRALLACASPLPLLCAQSAVTARCEATSGGGRRPQSPGTRTGREILCEHRPCSGL